MTRKLIEEHGCTQGCLGCEALKDGLSRRSHSSYCRERVALELDKTIEGKKRLENGEKRLRDNQAKSEDSKENLNEANDESVEVDLSGMPTDLSDNESSSEDDASSDDGNKGVLALLNRIASNGCIAEEVREILEKLDSHSKVASSCLDAGDKEIDNDISEVYSLVRVNARAARHGLRQGFSLDLTNDDSEGNSWDFNGPRMRAKAWK